MLLHIYHLLMCRSTRWYRNQLRKRERRFLQPKVKPNCNSDHSPFPHFPTVQQWIYAETKGTGLYNYSWPIVFSSALSGLASHQGSKSCFGTCINLSNEGFKLLGPYSDTNAYYVVGIGK